MKEEKCRCEGGEEKRRKKVQCRYENIAICYKFELRRVNK